MGSNPSNRLAYVILVISVVIGVVAIYLRDARAPETGEGGPVRVFYDSKGGAVVFDHAKHTAREGGECIVCHHYDGEDEEKGNCRECHEESDIPVIDSYHEKGEDYLEEEDYQSCMSCHEAKGRDPKNCRGCHK